MAVRMAAKAGAQMAVMTAVVTARRKERGWGSERDIEREQERGSREERERGGGGGDGDGKRERE